MNMAQSTTDARADLLLNDPPMVTNYSLDAWDHMKREDIDAMQLAGLRRRFAELRDAVPVLKKLADAQGVDAIEKVDDAVPLLFEHTVFKSYPPSLLENNRFMKMLFLLAMNPIQTVQKCM